MVMPRSAGVRTQLRVLQQMWAKPRKRSKTPKARKVRVRRTWWIVLLLAAAAGHAHAEQCIQFGIPLQVDDKIKQPAPQMPAKLLSGLKAHLSAMGHGIPPEVESYLAEQIGNHWLQRLGRWKMPRRSLQWWKASIRKAKRHGKNIVLG